MFTRYITSLFGALAITFALFLGMNFLIAPDTAEKSKIKKSPPLIIGTVRKPIDPTQEIEKPLRPETTVIRDFPKLTPKTKPDTVTIGTNFLPPLQPKNSGDPQFIGLSEGDIQPITKFAPNYPSNLQSKGIEGYVVVKFTVSNIGSVENIVVVESTHKSFNRNSVRAIKKYKYKPRVIDGIAVAVHDVMEKISFKIDESL